MEQERGGDKEARVGRVGDAGLDQGLYGVVSSSAPVLFASPSSAAMPASVSFGRPSEISSLKKRGTNLAGHPRQPCFGRQSTTLHTTHSSPFLLRSAAAVLCICSMSCLCFVA